jgi:hypothetical protein
MFKLSYILYLIDITIILAYSISLLPARRLSCPPSLWWIGGTGAI